MIGAGLYRMTVGFDWRTHWWREILQMLWFSAFGLAVYTLLTAPLLGKVPLLGPAHVLPSAYVDFGVGDVVFLAIPFLGHAGTSALAGLASAKIVHRVGSHMSHSAYASVWDEFVHSEAQERWVVVTLSTGDVLAGYILSTDLSVASHERDLLLAKPARYNASTEEYCLTGYECLYVQGKHVDSVASVSVDNELNGYQLGPTLFAEGDKKEDSAHEEREGESASRS